MMVHSSHDDRLPSYYDDDIAIINYRQRPELYAVGRGEQGVLMIEPYKSEILPFWCFKNPEIATHSSQIITKKFLEYVAQEDFVGADMARKFLQMGFTRARRYANHASGKKYSQNPQDEKTMADEKAARKKYLLPIEHDLVKAKSAEIFYQAWQIIENNERYKHKKVWRKKTFG